jgi:hypothetical protein
VTASTLSSILQHTPRAQMSRERAYKRNKHEIGTKSNIQKTLCTPANLNTSASSNSSTEATVALGGGDKLELTAGMMRDRSGNHDSKNEGATVNARPCEYNNNACLGAYKSPEGLTAVGTVDTMTMRDWAVARELTTSSIKRWDRWRTQDTRANRQARDDRIARSDGFDSKVKV